MSAHKQLFVVAVVWYSDRGKYMASWRDGSGEHHISTGTADLAEAEAFAADLQERLQSQHDLPLVAVSWARTGELLADFCHRQSKGYEDKMRQAMKALGSGLRLDQDSTIAEINANSWARVVAWCRERNNTEATIKGHLTHLNVFFRWMLKMRLIAKMPSLPKSPHPKTVPTKGKPLSRESIDRYMAAITEDVVGEKSGDWRWLAQCLLESGIPLARMMALSWDNDKKPRVVFIEERAYIKTGRDLEPVTDGFSTLLRSIPPEDRVGYVVSVGPQHGGDWRLCNTRVSKGLAAIGKAAGIVTWTHPVTKRPKYASARDLQLSCDARRPTDTRRAKRAKMA